MTSPGKAALEDYFRPRPELDDFLADKGKSDLLSGVDRITDGLDISYVTQRRQLGLGHAVLTARPTPSAPSPSPSSSPTTSSPPLPRPSASSLTSTTPDKASVLAVQRVPKDRISGYGVIDS